MEYQLIQLLKRDAHTVIGMLDKLETYLELGQEDVMNESIQYNVLRRDIDEVTSVRLVLMRQFKAREGDDL